MATDWKTGGFRACRLALAALLASFVGAAAAQPLSPDEVAAVAGFEHSRGLGGMAREMRAGEAARVAEAYKPARARFAGQGARVARHFLRHTGHPPSSGAYAFVIEAVSDLETVQALVEGLIEPPEPESGPTFESRGRTQRLPRYEGEIAFALEAALVAPEVARDPRVAAALEQAIARLRAKPRGIGLGTAALALELLGYCDSEAARETLRRLAADPDPDFRAAALAALGSAGTESDASLLGRSLLADPQPSARAEAARAIGRKRLRDALPSLEQALDAERAPQVVDAVLHALAELDALPTDRARCLDAAGRGWDPGAITPAFTCWRAGADHAALVEAATRGRYPVRALAMAALAPPSEPRAPGLMRIPERIAPPPPPTSGGAASAVAVLPPPPPRAALQTIDAATGGRLLESAVELLSRPARAFPDRADAISHGVASRVNDLLYVLAGGDMRRALSYADRIRTPGARTPNDGRFAASYALHRADPDAYAAVRRPRQALLASALAVLALSLAFLRPARYAAVAASLPLAAWTMWTLGAGGVRELPPLELAPMTVVGSASIAAALVAAGVVLWRARGGAAGWVRGLRAGGGAVGIAALAGFFGCGMLRWYDVFPIGGEGWELIFDPIGAALLAGVLAALGVAAAALAKRLTA